LTMLAMYLLGIVVALLMAWLFKKTLLKGETPMLIMELPPYKRPLVRVVMRHMWDRSKVFLRRAGTVILGINILLWFLATYPKHAEITKNAEIQKIALTKQLFPELQGDNALLQKADEIQGYQLLSITNASGSFVKIAPADTNVSPLTNVLSFSQAQAFTNLQEVDKQAAGEHLRKSFAGMAGRAIEPVIAPLGFDWKMGIGIISSFAAREVFVSTMSTVYNVGNADEEASKKELVETLKQQKHSNGAPVYTALLGVTLMVFYVFAMQCASTVAVVRRETNSWKWPVFQWAYMGILAWGLAFLTFHLGHWLGWG